MADTNTDSEATASESVSQLRGERRGARNASAEASAVDPKAEAIDEGLLREPADRGIRLIALSLVDDAHHAAEKLLQQSGDLRDGDTDGDDALHDFRVAVRRLRSWIRAFRPQLERDLTRKRRRRLSKIAEATNAIRDATVHLEWLRAERRASTPRERAGHKWLAERLSTVHANGSGPALRAAHDLEDMVDKLTRRLNVYCSAVLSVEPPARFGTVLAARVLEESEALQSRLAGIDGMGDVEGAHRARIAAKHLRYVAEPASTVIPDGDSIIETLKSLQNALGDLHDVHVFSKEIVTAAEEAAASQTRRVSEAVLGESPDLRAVRRARSSDPVPGILHLATRLHDRGARAYADIERDWLEGAGASFFDRVRDFAARIASA